MKEVEIRVRALGGFAPTDYGKQLMIEAFKAPGGRLSDLTLPSAEQEGTMQLFMGAIAVFKNPNSHREVDFEDPTIAAEIVLFADLLLRLLDQRAAKGPPPLLPGMSPGPIPGV
jgi:uncharacterized protein (TIGR02391 family)